MDFFYRLRELSIEVLWERKFWVYAEGGNFCRTSHNEATGFALLDVYEHSTGKTIKVSSALADNKSWQEYISHNRIYKERSFFRRKAISSDICSWLSLWNWRNSFSENSCQLLKVIWVNDNLKCSTSAYSFITTIYSIVLRYDGRKFRAHYIGNFRYTLPLRKAP